jgi:hypothetical protein
MPANRRTHAVRITALALAGAVNLLFLSLWLLSRAHVAPETAITAMIWITTPLVPRMSPKTPEPRPRVPSTVRTPLPRVTPSTTPAPTTAITAAPIDWYAEGTRSARNAFKDEVHEKPAPSLDSRPVALVLPDKSKQPHKKGDTEHFEGGEVITWLNERCYVSNRPGPIGFGGASQKICKVRSMAARRSEAMAAELEKDAKPEYLSRPLPLPPLPPEPVVPDVELARY